MGGGISQLPENGIDKKMCASVLADKFNLRRWNEIRSDEGTISKKQLQIEVATHSHNYPPGSIQFQVKLNEEVENDDERVEEDNNNEGRSRAGSDGILSINYPPNHPKSRTTAFSEESSNLQVN